MPRKTPNFGGLSLKDVAKANTEAENSIAKSDNSNGNISNAKNRAAKVKPLGKENSTAKNGRATPSPDLLSNAQNSNATAIGKDKSDAKNSIATNGIPTATINNDENSIAIKNTHNAKISNANIDIVKNSIAKNVNQALFTRVRDYFYNLLGENESAEVKFSEVIQDLEINPHSFYKYFRTLRETDFVVTKLRYSTEIRRR